MKHIVEIVVTSVEDAIAAEKGGADRLEICSALSTGGITPSLALFHAIQKAVSIPLFVLIRPREGDFIYTLQEQHIMEEDIKTFVREGANGIVVGMNTAKGEVDIKAMAKMIDAAGELPVTFHRAIDVCHDPLEALEDVIALGCARVLTSGGRPKLDMTGIAVVHEMAEIAAEANVIILPGGGINTNNIDMLLDHPYIIEYHHSAKKLEQSPLPTDIFESNYYRVDETLVRLRK